MNVSDCRETMFYFICTIIINVGSVSAGEGLQLTNTACHHRIQYVQLKPL